MRPILGAILLTILVIIGFDFWKGQALFVALFMNDELKGLEFFDEKNSATGLLSQFRQILLERKPGEGVRKSQPHGTDFARSVKGQQDEGNGEELMARHSSDRLASDHPEDRLGSIEFINALDEDLKKNPEKAMTRLQAALNRLSYHHQPLERIAILGHMVQLGEKIGKSDEVRKLALSEMKSFAPEPETGNNVTESPKVMLQKAMGTPDTLLPITAYEIYIQNSNDPQESLNLTVDAIVFQKNPGVRLAMAVEFLKKFPDLQVKLDSALTAQSVEIPSDAVIEMSKEMPGGLPEWSSTAMPQALASEQK